MTVWHAGNKAPSKEARPGNQAGATVLQRRHALDAKRRRRGSTTEEKWVKMHEQLARELNAADEGKGFDVLFYGDSILESTR